jgi:hypothetical protein
MNRRTIALLCGMVAAGALSPWGVQAGELDPPAAHCCAYSIPDCEGAQNPQKEPLPWCCTWGVDCSQSEPGHQFYCMKAC